MMFTLGQNKALIPIKEAKIDLEKDLQSITEHNIGMILGLKFISSEFSLHEFRIDTLAFDEETKSFVIIEYKRDRSFSVIDQGFAYLALMLNNKADFILEFNEKLKGELKRDDVDWSQSRVLFFANSFTTYQRSAINFKDLPIELWEVKKYDNDTVLYNQLESATARESLNKVVKNETIEKVSKEVKKNSIDDHFREGWDYSRELFNDIRERILSMDNRMVENPNPKDYIGYKIGTANVCSIHVYKSKLLIQLIRVDKEDLNDPEDKVVKVSWKEWKWPKLCNYEIENQNDIDYGIFLIKQVYEKYYK